MPTDTPRAEPIVVEVDDLSEASMQRVLDRIEEMKVLDPNLRVYLPWTEIRLPDGTRFHMQSSA